MRTGRIVVFCFLSGFIAHWIIASNINHPVEMFLPVLPIRSSNQDILLPPQNVMWNSYYNCSLTNELNSKIKNLKKSLVVYIYDFPDKFHKTLEDTYFRKSRYDLSYESFGNSVRTERGMIFRNTYQGTFDIIFHKRLRDTWNITNDPEMADVFFVPYYYDMTVKEDLNTDVATSGELEKELNKLPYYKAKKPHLLANGWPMGLLGFYDFLVMTVEKLGKRMLVVPYPSYGHITHVGGGEYAQKLFLHNRNVFVFMAARDRTTRRARHEIYSKVTRRTTLPMDKEYKASNLTQHDKIEVINYTPAPGKYTPDIAAAIVEWMYNSIFCLQPPGDTDTRKSFYDSVTCGCIPVIFELDHKVEYPFESVFDYSSFSVKIPRNKQIQFLDVLHAYSQNDIVSMQQNLRCVMQYLQYNDVTAYDAGPDAFTMIMMEVKSRFNITKIK